MKSDEVFHYISRGLLIQSKLGENQSKKLRNLLLTTFFVILCDIYQHTIFDLLYNFNIETVNHFKISSI